MKHSYFFLCLCLCLAACGEKVAPKPIPLDITGTWKIVGNKMNPQQVSEPAKALALLEFGAQWTFKQEGILSIDLDKKRMEVMPILSNYEWIPKQKTLLVTGNHHFYYDITYHTNDSLALYNRETNITYEFDRVNYGKPTLPIDSTLLPPPIDSSLLPVFDGKWDMKYLVNERIEYSFVLKMNEIAGEQIWNFGPHNKFILTHRGKTTQGKWSYNRNIQKLMIELGGKKQVYRVVSLAQKSFTIISAQSGNEFLFNKSK